MAMSQLSHNTITFTLNWAEIGWVLQFQADSVSCLSNLRFICAENGETYTTKIMVINLANSNEIIIKCSKIEIA